MKIVHLCLSSFYIEGFGYQENIIPKYNKKDGHEVTIIASKFTYNKNNGKEEEADAGEYINHDGIKVIRIEYKYPMFGKLNSKLKIYAGTYELIAKERPDLIFSHGIQFIDLNEVVRYVKDNQGCRLVADSHAAYINSGLTILSRVVLHKIIYRKIIQNSLKYIDRLFVIAPGCRDFAKDMYGIQDDKMEYLFLGADTDRIDFDKKDVISIKIRDELGIKIEDTVLITGGKLSKGKNLKLLIDAFRLIDSINIKLIIFGVLSDDIREEMIEMMSRDSRIKYLGWIESDKVYDYYLSSNIAIFPGTKSALWEQAICSGLPLICKKWSGMEYVDLGGNVIFIKGDDEDELKYSINKIINDSELYKQMKTVAKEIGYKKFSYKSISRDAISLLNK